MIGGCALFAMPSSTRWRPIIIAIPSTAVRLAASVLNATVVLAGCDVGPALAPSIPRRRSMLPPRSEWLGVEEPGEAGSEMLYRGVPAVPGSVHHGVGQAR